MLIIAYLCATIMGIMLGMLGAGGAILTIPVLVYIAHIDPIEAIVYSYLIVGIVSVSQTIQNFRKSTIDIESFLWFGIPSLIMIALYRKGIDPWIPQVIFQKGEFLLSKTTVLMLAFSLILFWAGLWILFNTPSPSLTDRKKNISKLLIVGLATGLLTGILGVGGGFIIVPSLILFLQIDIKKATSTSLAIIALNCSIGFLLSYQTLVYFNYKLILPFIALAMLGMFIGYRTKERFDSKELKKVLAFVLIITSIVILIAELI